MRFFAESYSITIRQKGKIILDLFVRHRHHQFSFSSVSSFCMIHIHKSTLPPFFRWLQLKRFHLSRSYSTFKPVIITAFHASIIMRLQASSSVIQASSSMIATAIVLIEATDPKVYYYNIIFVSMIYVYYCLII